MCVSVIMFVFFVCFFTFLTGQVTFASQQRLAGHLEYIQTIWEYLPGRYGIIGGICGLVLLIVIIIPLIVLKHMKRRNHAGNSPGWNSENLVSRVKRWSRKTAARTSTFIPSGPRTHTDKYNPTVPDIRAVPSRTTARTRPETFIEGEHFNLEHFEPYHTTFRNDRSSFI